MPSAHFSEVVLLLASYVVVSSDDFISKLCSHARIVLLRSNSFVFEITGRTFDDYPLCIELGMDKLIPIVDRVLA